jgi:hypothetical protein
MELFRDALKQHVEPTLKPLNTDEHKATRIRQQEQP